MKKVSVILTTCNSESTIQRTIQSILNQEGINTIFTLELIVVDDCSTDKTVEILCRNNINFLSTQQNSGGPNKGRNMGLKMITGDFYCFIDHDDVWASTKIIKQLPLAELYPVVSSGYNIINKVSSQKTERKLYNPAGYVTFSRNETFLLKLKRSNTGQNLYLSTLMLNNSLKNIRFEENFGMVDYDWILRITVNNETVEITDNLVTRHVNQSNLSLDKVYRQKDYYYSLYFLENYKSEYPSEYRMAIKRLNGTRARYHYLCNDMKEARRFFIKSEINIKQIGYILTSFIGNQMIKRNFTVFG